MVEKAAILRIKFKLSVIGVLLCLFSLAGVSPLHAGWYEVAEYNESDIAWGDYHFEIFAIPGHEGNPRYDITNVAFDVSGSHAPQSTQKLDAGNEWTLTDGNKKISLNFYNDPYAANATTNGTWTVFINNPDRALYGVSTYPSVVPEPISSVLFFIGGAGLVARHSWKKRKTA